MRLFRIPTGVYGLALLIFTDVASGEFMQYIANIIHSYKFVTDKKQ